IGELQSPSMTVPRLRLRSALLPLAVPLLLTFIIARGISKGELDYNVDEAQHGVTGLFFADFLSDRPLAHPVQYAYHYYAQYPALGFVHWPPLFHFCEGVLFLLLGPSVIAARLTVLLFALLGSVFWFKLVSKVENEWTAAICALVL